MIFQNIQESKAHEQRGRVKMSINRYLEETASKLIIKGNEKESIDVSLNTFKDRMRDYFSKNESVNLKEIKVFGSYQRDTNLPQSVDYGTDVDIMLVMDNDGSTPQTYLDRVRRGVEAKYSTSQIRQSSPTVVLQMLHIKFEITPAIMDSGLYRIKIIAMNGYIHFVLQILAILP